MNFGIPTTIWGLGDYQNLSSIGDGKAFDWSGDLFMGHFGIDALIRDGLLAGISASVAESEINFDNIDANNIQFDFRTTSLNPYIGWTSSNQNTELNATAGFGQGEIGIDQKEYNYETLNSEIYTMGLSGSQVLFTSDRVLNGTSNLSVKGESWFSRYNLDGKDNLFTDLHTDSHYYNIRTEAKHQFEFTRGSSLTPLIAVGIRGDRKGQQSTLAPAISSGIDFVTPIGFTFNGSGNLLMAGDDNTFQKMNASSSLKYDYGQDNLGLTFEFSPTWGHSFANAQNSLWRSSAF